MRRRADVTLKSLPGILGAVEYSRHKTGVTLLAVLLTAFTQPVHGRAQHAAAVTQDEIPALIAEAVKYQLDDFHHASWGLRYRVHRIDNKEDSTRELIESAQGNVARTLMREGKPLSSEQDTAERARLESIDDTVMAKHRHGAESTDKFGTELISALPKAMLYTLTPGQPQLPLAASSQIVLEMNPNPAYHPSTTAQSLLSGIAGRVWIDSETHHLVRIELRVIKNLNLMFGLLAHVYEGGTLAYEQHPVADGHYAYSRIDIDVRLRELMVKVVPYKSTLTTSDVVLLPAVPHYKDAIKQLLAVPLPATH
jgi:hypothetical protein